MFSLNGTAALSTVALLASLTGVTHVAAATNLPSQTSENSPAFRVDSFGPTAAADTTAEPNAFAAIDTAQPLVPAATDSSLPTASEIHAFAANPSITLGSAPLNSVASSSPTTARTGWNLTTPILVIGNAATFLVGSIPEPTSLTLLALGSVTLLRRRKRA